MSQNTQLAERWQPPQRRVPVVEVTEENITDFWNLFVNRLAYTRQSDHPGRKTGKFYYYPPLRSRTTKERLPLDRDAVRRHLVGWQTIGLYAIQPRTQCSKWIAIDADYGRAPYDLAALRDELLKEGVEALEEMSRRGGHLWIFCQEPLPARECKIYIYNLALRLGIPIKRTGNDDGVEVFPRQEELAPGRFGFQIRGPLGVHRGAMRRYWFRGAPPILNDQLAFLKAAKKLTADELRRLTNGMTLPEEYSRPRVEVKPPASWWNGNGFRILDYVNITEKEGSDYRALCPSCGLKNDPKAHHLAISIAEPWKYRCWFRCTKEMIREAVGRPIPKGS